MRDSRRARSGRPAVTILLVLALAAATWVGVAPVGGQQGDDAATAETGPRVSLYQNGLALVEEAHDVPVDGMLTLRVPRTTLMESLRVLDADVRVQEIRADLQRDGFLEPGERVIVHATDNRSYAGTLLEAAHDGSVHLARADGGEVRVPRESVVALELPARPGADAPPGPEATVRLDLAAADGGGVPDRVRVAYLAQGPGWTPSYQLDVPSGNLTFLATLTGLEDWDNATLDLVAGSPNLVARPVPGLLMDRAFEVEAAGLDAAEDAPVSGPEAVGALHRYRLQEPVDLNAGETVRIPVRSGALDVMRHAYEAEAHVSPRIGPYGAIGDAQEVPVREVYELHNTLDVPLPPGPVHLYRNATWVGEDQLDGLPRDARANVTAATSEEVQARLVLENTTSTAGRDVATHALVVDNHRNETVDLRASLTFPPERTNLQNATPPPTRVEGATVTWDDTLPAGASATYRIQLETLREPRPEPVAAQAAAAAH